MAKAEFLNPGGSVKDRVALHIIQDAFAEGRLQKGGLITEGTAGSTGAPSSIPTSAAHQQVGVLALHVCFIVACVYHATIHM